MAPVPDVVDLGMAVFFSNTRAMPLRVPLAHPTTTGLSRAISPSRAPSSIKGMLTVPGALAAANSAADRTSSSKAPLARKAGNMALTRRDRHHA